MELVHGQESHLALSNRDVPSILDASFKFTRPSCLIATKAFGHLCVWSKKYLEETCVTSAVIGVFVGLTFASVLMHQKWVSRSRFVKERVACRIRESCEDFPDVLLQLLNLSEWK